MHISQNFPHLRKQDALFVVAGKRVAKIFKVQNGEFLERDAIEIKTPEYSDKEGFYEQLAGGHVQGFGSRAEVKDDYIFQRFLKQLVEHVKKVGVGVKALYLFAPKEVLRQIKKRLPGSLIARRTVEVTGNFTKHHPFELIKRASEGGPGLPLSGAGA